MTVTRKLYRVVDHVAGPDAHCSWIVEEREARVGLNVNLQRSFSDMVLKRFPGGAIGSLFFRTPVEAVRHFEAQGRATIERAYRMQREANAMLSWAMTWEAERIAACPCAISMRCLCAGHARGNAPDMACDTTEIPVLAWETKL